MVDQSPEELFLTERKPIWRKNNWSKRSKTNDKRRI